MVVSKLFQIFTRALVLLFVISAISSGFMRDPQIDKKQLEEYDIKSNQGPSYAKWVKKDLQMASARIKIGHEAMLQGSLSEAKEHFRTASFILADEMNTSEEGAKLSKLIKALESLPVLQQKLEANPVQNKKLVEIITKNSAKKTGHIIEESETTYSIEDEIGFVNVIAKSNVLKLDEFIGKDKEKFYVNQLKNVIAENGKLNAYSLYVSAKWAHDHGLKNESNKLLINAAEIDPNPVQTIETNDVKNLLMVGRWSNAIGDFKLAKEKANLIIASYPDSEHSKLAQELISEVDRNIEMMKKMESKQKAMAIATIKLAPVVDEEKPAQEDNQVAEVRPDVVEEKPQEQELVPINTLKLKSSTEGQTNEEAITEKPSDEEELVVKEDPRREIPPENKILSDKYYVKAMELVNEGKELTSQAHGFNNMGHKKAQLNFKKAVTKFEEAIDLINKLLGKYKDNEELEELAQQANGLKFYIKKNCLRLK